MSKYYIHHATGKHLVTIECESDTEFMQKINSGAVTEIEQYTFLQVYCDNPQSTYPMPPSITTPKDTPLTN